MTLDIIDPLRITHYALDADHCIKKRLINQQPRDNIGDKPMNRQTYLLLLLLIVCLSIPSGAAAQYTLTKISGDGQTGRRGQPLEPFVVKVLDQDSNPVANQQVHFLPAPDTIPVSLTQVFANTDGEGLAQTTVTLRSTGTATIIASVGAVTATFTARAIAPPTITTSTTPSPPPPPEPDPTVFFRVLGNNQSGVVGELLAKPFVVGTRDRGGDPLEGMRVVFRVLAGGGSLSAEIAWTDAKGRAGSILTLGSDPGTNTVEVSAHGTSRVLIFSAEGTLPPVPTTLSIISGDNQSGLVGEALANPFAVAVRDENGNPLEGVTVTFAVSAGGGSLSDTSVETDANGLAQSILALGSDPGANTVEVSAENIEETATFTAEGTLPPPTPTALSIVSGENQEGLTGETLANPLVVQVHDQYGNPIEGVTVTFTVHTGTGALLDTTVTTDENGRAETTLTLGNDPGANTVQVSVEGIVEPVTFNLIAELLEFGLSLPAGINLIHIPLKVRTVNGMPAEIQSVSDLYDALGGVDTVNWLITHDPQDQIWYGYFGDADRGTIADSVLTDQIGILASIKTPISIRLGGDALGTDGASTITLNQGLNLVGLPLRDSRIMRVSDLFVVEEIGKDIAIIVVTDNGEFRAVGRADDLGDISVTGGQGFILIVQQLGTIPIIGVGWDNVP